MNLAIFLVLAQLSAPTARTRIDEARKQLDDLKYKQAGDALAGIAQLRSLSRDEALDFYATDGLLRAGLNDAAGSRRSFGWALLIAPDFKLAGKPSPRVNAAFAEAKAWARSHPPLDVTLAAKEMLEDRWVLTFALPPVEADWTDAVVFTITEPDGPRTVEAPAGTPARLELAPLATRVTWRVLDARGWVLHEGEPLKIEPLVAPQPRLPSVASLLPRQQEVVAPPKEPRPRVITWIAGGLALVGAGVAITTGIFVSNDQVQLTSAVRSRAENDMLVNRMSLNATICNVSWAAAGAMLILGVVMFFVEGR